jgi:hypothetical protein
MKIPSNSSKKLPASRRFLFSAACLLPLMSIALRRLGFKRCYAAINRMTAKHTLPSPPSALALDFAKRIAGSVIGVNRRYSFYQASCLAESLVICALLRRRGITARICLGVRTITGVFESHAWIEYDGQVLNDIDRVNQIYMPFDLSRLEPKAG